ncbi:hypothetical protein [uncultured Brachyspira sp.]|uniref:hypothetical protein n=1 Tax=uncultured Brachyspira sp. TaxID=221953 RepID=UPI0027DC35AE|nr:hypothetical protein [uncultured Brachyspira sp.]
MFSANFEFAFGVGAGATTEFSCVLDREESFFSNGDRVDNGLSVTAFLDIVDNFELPNGGVLSSISVLFETGYNYYMRIRTRYKEYPEYRHKFFYHNLILGIMPKLNFDYGISFGIGAGILLPLYSKSSKNNHEVNHGLAGYYYDHIKEFDFEKISYMYKVPIMPYIKLNLEKNFYMSELWAFKIGANLVYNFGMEFNMDKLKSDTNIYGYDKYNFSSLFFEVFFGFGFGRPK